MIIFKDIETGERINWVAHQRSNYEIDHVEIGDAKTTIFWVRRMEDVTND